MSDSKTTDEARMSGTFSRRPDGTWEPAIPMPFYWGLLPWLWRRLTGWRDAYGRSAQFIGWRE